MTQPASEPRVALRGVSHFYDLPNGTKLHAVGPVDLAVQRGEFFTIVGPSGCGKSTLLDVIAGLTNPTHGEVMVEGRRVDSVPDGIGVVFQEDATFPWLSVFDNVAFGLRRAGVKDAEVKRRTDHAVGFMGLRDFADVYPAQLSGGMRQRVSIARTMVLQPRILLLDEPFGALDQQTRLLMGDELLRVWRETGASVVFVTHSLDEAAMLSDRVGVMSARPGIFVDVIETKWPGERGSAVMADPRFGALSAQLWELLRAETTKAMQQR